MIKIVSYKEWTKRAEVHHRLVSLYADAYVQRRNHGQKHPVHDFLFTYYPFSPNKLKQWIPSIDEALEIGPGLKNYPWFNEHWFIREGTSFQLNRKRLHEQTLALTIIIKELCENILGSPPRYGCFGLHEWAMVYRLSPEELRHSGYRLRLNPNEIARFVESQNLCCTHYDAFRFFTAEAKPLNLFQPTIKTRLQHEQGGCLHANMDIYKWSTTLWPWIGLDFIAQAYILALEGRELDMRASPYDLLEHGYVPIKIETEEGRREYQQAQKLYAEKATALRETLRDFCIHLHTV